MGFAKRHATVLVSASLGGIDRVPYVPAGRDYDAIFFTDEQTVQRSDPASIASWDLVVTPPYPRRDWHPRLRAKYFKLQIHRLEEVQPYDYLAWIDARHSVTDHRFPPEKVTALKKLAPWRRLAIFAHPERNTIKEEVDYINQSIANGDEYLAARYANEDMTGELAYYESRGWPVDGRLLAGTFWIVENAALMARCFDDWWDHNLRFTIMDQLSLPVVLAKNYIEPEIIAGNLYNNSIFRWGAHDMLI